MPHRQQHSTVRNGIGSYTLKNGQTRYRVVMAVNGKTVSKGSFTTKGAAGAWRDVERAKVVKGDWIDPTKGRTLFGALATDWLATADVRPSTRAVYQHLFDHQLAPWMEVPLVNITPTSVRHWLSDIRKTPGTRTKRPPSRAYVDKAYALLRNVCNDCVPARGVEARAFLEAVGQFRGAAGKASSPG